MSTEGERRAGINLERHVQTVMIAITTGAIMFAGSYIFDDTGSRAAQETQLRLLTAQVIEMRAELRAMEKSLVRRDEFIDHETRLRGVEAQISRLLSSIERRGR